MKQLIRWTAVYLKDLAKQSNFQKTNNLALKQTPSFYLLPVLEYLNKLAVGRFC